ncbi:MAG: glycosyltransferase [Candidatus Iainarchaeum archaeon]|uniref:Glycosyltransferase n=1 Tax=Candidatus Iainarchaeum sp. TaxID=3101447 RepID=A0A7T9DKU9_9ARCH|nr:MAG: glycosyltransferase [Candidatus Diapherotrites archaeon]
MNKPIIRSRSITVDNKPIRILMLIPEEKNCGITTYAHYLLMQLQPLGGLQVEIAINHAQNRLAEYALLASELEKNTNIIHVQFEFARFGKLFISGVGTPFFYRALSGRTIVVTTLHELPPKDKLFVRLAQCFFLSFILDKSHHIIVHTAESARQLHESHPQYAHKIIVIPHGMLEFNLETKKKNLPIEWKDKKIIGAFGFPAPHKHFESVIEAIAALPEEYVAVMGVGAQTQAHEIYLARLQQYAKELHVAHRVIWNGFVEEQKMAEFFSWLDVVIFPYSHVTESGALALALAHRKAVIARDLPTFREIADKHHCIQLFSTQEELAALIHWIVENPRERKQLIANIDGILAARNWKTIAEQHKKLYVKLAGSEH